MQQKVADGTFRVMKVRSADNRSDALTKHVEGYKLESHVKSTGMFNTSTHCIGWLGFSSTCMRKSTTGQKFGSEASEFILKTTHQRLRESL